jgi:large subunit ribosomal protein L15
METTKDIVSKAPMEGARSQDELGFEREPFENEQLLQVDNLNAKTPSDVVAKEKLHSLAMQVGMLDVLRWKPRLVGQLLRFPTLETLTYMLYRSRINWNHRVLRRS